jgi:hypothetical protein
MLTVSGPHLALYLMVPWALYRGKGGRYLRITAHLYLVQKLERIRDIPAQPHYVFLLCVGWTFPLCLY